MKLYVDKTLTNVYNFNYYTQKNSGGNKGIMASDGNTMDLNDYTPKYVME